MKNASKLALAAFTGIISAGVVGAGLAHADSGSDHAKSAVEKNSCKAKSGCGAAAKEKNSCKGKNSCSSTTAKEKHACKGLNSCKGQGADGKNACKGHGSCKTAE